MAQPTVQITNATTVANLFNVADNAAIVTLCGDADALFASIEGNDELIAAVEAIVNADGSYDPQAVIDAAAEYLKDIKAALKAETKAATIGTSATVGGKTYVFADAPIATKETTRVFVMTQVRCYGEIRKSRTKTASDYRAVNIGGYYLVNNADGSISTHPDNILTNSALVEKFIPNFDINTDEMDISGLNLAFNVVTESRVANVTTYAETAPEALTAAQKAGKKVIRNASGINTVLCYHTVSSDFAFRRLGAKITEQHLKMLNANVERVAEARLKAIEETAKDKEMSLVNTQREVAVVKAKEEASAEAIGMKINAVVGNAEVLAKHNIDMQALLIAALSSK